MGDRRWITGLAGRVMVAACLSVAGSLVLAQDKSSDKKADESVTLGVAPPKDTIFARKILMGAIDMNMDEIEGMLVPGAKLDSAEAREHADTISIMLMSFPHLFPAATNQWRPNVDRDPATDTYASPELWSRFGDFYKRATDASRFAYQASRAQSREAFSAAITQLRAACNACHAAYQKTD